MGMGGFGSLKKTLLDLKRSKRGSKVKKVTIAADDGADNKFIEKPAGDKAEHMNAAAHNYFQQNFLEKGPYNLLKMKK